MYCILSDNTDTTSAKSIPFPEIKGWTSQDVEYTSIIQDILSPDRVIYRHYNKDENLSVTLFIACYTTLENTDKSHAPEVCFSGQGWRMKTRGVKNISTAQGDKIISVNEISQIHGRDQMVVFYWFQSPYGITTNRGIQKLKLFIDRLLGKKVSSAFVRVTSTVPYDMEIDGVSSYMEVFVKELEPVLSEYLLAL